MNREKYSPRPHGPVVPSRRLWHWSYVTGNECNGRTALQLSAKPYRKWLGKGRSLRDRAYQLPILHCHQSLQRPKRSLTWRPPTFPEQSQGHLRMTGTGNSQQESGFHSQRKSVGPVTSQPRTARDRFYYVGPFLIAYQAAERHSILERRTNAQKS